VAKKSCVIYLNCHGGPFVRGLRSYPEFRAEFDLHRFITHETITLPKLPEEMGKTIATADVLIYNPVSPRYGFASSDEVLKLTKPDCLKICVPYYRFHGFWDRADQAQLTALKRLTGCGIFVNRSCLEGEARYSVNWALDTQELRSHAIAVFNDNLEKFKEIDEGSDDVSMVEWFNDNYRDQALFPNHLHPAPIFMDEVVSQVAAICGLSGRANTGRALDQYSWPVQPAVAEALALTKTPTPKILDDEFTLAEYLHIVETFAAMDKPVGGPGVIKAYIKENIVHA
jgi:hypothetical protein